MRERCLLPLQRYRGCRKAKGMQTPVEIHLAVVVGEFVGRHESLVGQEAAVFRHKAFHMCTPLHMPAYIPVSSNEGEGLQYACS